MTTESVPNSDEEAAAERPDWLEDGGGPLVRLVRIHDPAPGRGKTAPAAGTGITPGEAELLGEYKLHNG